MPVAFLLDDEVKPSRVTGDRTQPNQVTALLGNFPVATTGSLNSYGYTELSHSSGNSQSINLSGVQTVRLSSLSANNNVQINFLLFVPATGGPKLTMQQSTTNIVLSWNPAVGVLESSSDLAAWSVVTGASIRQRLQSDHRATNSTA